MTTSPLFKASFTPEPVGNVLTVAASQVGPHNCRVRVLPEGTPLGWLNWQDTTSASLTVDPSIVRLGVQFDYDDKGAWAYETEIELATSAPIAPSEQTTPRSSRPKRDRA